MAKKKTAKTDRTNKAPLEPITAEPKVQAAGEDSVNLPRLQKSRLKSFRRPNPQMRSRRNGHSRQT